ncbi:MAG: DUF2637 domain-containing protein [Gemmatimonadota bacterium]
MNDHPRARGPRTADPHPNLLRLTALVAVIVGVLLLAAAAFVLSYAGIHQIALAAGVKPALARYYPMIFDAMLVIAFAAALTLRGAGWWTKCFVWLSTLVLVAAVAAGDAVRAMGVSLPKRPAAAAAAVIPWTLLLLAFWLWLAMLRQFRRSRAAAPAAPASDGPASDGPAGDGSASDGGRDTANGAHPPRLGLDALLEPRPGAAAPSLGDRVAAASTQPVLPAPAATRPVALPAASPQAEAHLAAAAGGAAGGPAAEDAGPDADAGPDDDYGHHLLVEEAEDFGIPADGEDEDPDDPAADYGEPDDAGPQHGETGQPGTGADAADGDGSARAEFGPPLTSQPLSAPPAEPEPPAAQPEPAPAESEPPPAQFERPHSRPTPPGE